MKEMYDDPQHVKDTFTEENLSKPLLHAQKQEFIELKKILLKIKKKDISILDIGIGDAKIPCKLSKIKEIWNKIKSYDGIDVAQNCVDLSKKIVKDMRIDDKVNVIFLDAINLKKLNKKYDLIISTWFTVGNFYPSDFSFEDFKPGEYNLSKNDKFTSIFKQAYEMLNEGGEIIIGSMYIDNEETRKKQEESYLDFGWHVITDERDSFTASKEGWWSQRFTKQRVYDYLHFIPKEKISFIPLDDYDYAMMVRIRK